MHLNFFGSIQTFLSLNFIHNHTLLSMHLPINSHRFSLHPLTCTECSSRHPLCHLFTNPSQPPSTGYSFLFVIFSKRISSTLTQCNLSTWRSLLESDNPI